MCDSKSHAPLPPNSDLRIPTKAPQKAVSITVDGRLIFAVEGETVHAALLASGIKPLRRTPSGQARGVFCGMGICYECLVTINQVPDQRACMTRVTEGMEILTREEVR